MMLWYAVIISLPPLLTSACTLYVTLHTRAKVSDLQNHADELARLSAANGVLQQRVDTLTHRVEELLLIIASHGPPPDPGC